MEGIRDGNPREAVAKRTGLRYTQHSTGVADGAEGFIAFFEPFIERNPKRDIRVVRSLQDGSHAFVHAHQILNDGETRWVTTNFFDSDAAGKIIEHWDVIEADKGSNSADRTKIDGPVNVTDLDRTEANKALVKDFIQTCLVERQIDRMTDFINPDKCLQHNSEMGDGLASFLEEFGVEGCPLTYQ